MRIEEFIIRPYRPGDEFKINEMFNEVFHRDRSIEHWYWKYRDNPYGSGRIALAIAPDGTLAAHYGGYPLKLFLATDKKEFTVYHLGDKMTRRIYRGVGIGKNSLLSLTFRAFQDNFARDALFGYGFGTHHSLRFGLMFLNYIDFEPVSFWRLPIERLLKGKGVSFLRQLFSLRRLKQVKEIDVQWDEFFYTVAPSYRLLIKRDSQYLNWRYLRRPDRQYLILSVTKKNRLTGWSVFFREGNRLIWGDALFIPDDTSSVKVLFSYLLRDPYCKGCETIEGWFAEDPQWWGQCLKSLGFERETEPSNLHLVVTIITDPEALTMLRKGFYYTLGDSDLF